MDVYTKSDSGVSAYEIGTDFIKVKFKESPKIYIYNNVKPGKVYVDKMKELAREGKGLGTYINKFVKENYYNFNI